MAQSTKQLSTKNIKAMASRLETSARRIEKEFERQLKALDQARANMQREAKKQIAAIRREQRGFLTRVRKAAVQPSRTRSTTSSSTRRSPARKTTRTRAA